MMLSDILTCERTFCGVEGRSKKRVLEMVSENLAKNTVELTADQIFTHLIARERLGSTGIGHGVAIPHARVENCQRTTGALILLKNKVDFDAADGEPVDLLFVLLIPDQDTEQANNQHLAILSMLAEMFSEGDLRQSLRSMTSGRSLYEAAIEYAKQVNN